MVPLVLYPTLTLNNPNPNRCMGDPMDPLVLYFHGLPPITAETLADAKEKEKESIRKGSQERKSGAKEGSGSKDSAAGPSPRASPAPKGAKEAVTAGGKAAGGRKESNAAVVRGAGFV